MEVSLTLLRSFWNQWEIRAFVLISQAYQITLISCADRRRTSPWLALVVWLTYLLANLVATLCLSTIFNDDNKAVYAPLLALWVPFLLLHLGGPDSITAYSLEDNDLWLRQFFTFSSQVFGSMYVYWKLWTKNDALSFIPILIFLSGLIKYGERIWMLKHSSYKRMTQYAFQYAEPAEQKLEPFPFDAQIPALDIDTYISRAGVIPEARYIHESFLMFQFFRPMFSNVTIRTYRSILYDTKLFHSITMKSTEEAFKLIEVELEFLYDLFYTKRLLLSTTWGIVLRAISCISLLTALIGFMLVMRFRGCQVSLVDMYISYFLLIVAIILDIYSIIVHCLSKWTIIRVTVEKCWITRFLPRVILARLCRHKDGCKSMAQFNLIDFSLVSRASPTGIEKWIDTDFVLRKYWHTKWQVVNSDLKELIKLHLIKQCCRYEVSNYDRSVLHEILDNKGDDALKQLPADIYDNFKSSINEVDFSYSLIVWHIATSICYDTDCSAYGIDILGQHCQSSKDLSDYMLYLQTVHRNMLPRGSTGEIRFRDTCNEIKRFVCRKGFTSSEFSRLVATPGGDPIFRIPGETKSVMREAIEIAGMLKDLVVEERWDVEEKWRLICQVWIEMLTYAAARCEWEEHIQELNRGREFLTHVSLLMAHMGLTNKVQILEYELETEFGIPPPPWSWNPLHQFTYYLSN